MVFLSGNANITVLQVFALCYGFKGVFLVIFTNEKHLIATC